MKTILAPIDFSNAATPVIETAVSLAKAFGARLTLLHVVYPSLLQTAYRLPPEKIDEQVAEEMKRSEKHLCEWKKRYAPQAADIETLCREGATADTIVNVAREFTVEFIVVGSHGHGALYELLVGTTARDVLKKAPCPVVVVPVRDK